MKKTGFSKKILAALNFIGRKSRITKKNRNMRGGAVELPQGIVYKPSDNTISIELKKYADDVEIVVSSEGDAPVFIGLPKYNLEGSEYNSLITIFDGDTSEKTLYLNGKALCKMTYNEFKRKSSPTPTNKSATAKSNRKYRYVFSVKEIVKDSEGNDML
jgi:hypothetical protein